MQDYNITQKTRILFALSEPAAKAVSEISDIYGGMPPAEVIRKALATELFLSKAIRDGSQIILKSPSKESVLHL